VAVGVARRAGSPTGVEIGQDQMYAADVAPVAPDRYDAVKRRRADRVNAEALRRRC
jgi:hypothetical protein